MTTSRKTSRARTATSREEDTMMLHGVAAHIVKLEREKAITPLMKVYKELLSQIQGPGYADVRVSSTHGFANICSRKWI